MSLSPQNTLEAAKTTYFECGHFSSSMRREIASQMIVLSATVAPTSVGHVGSTVPETRIGTASHVTVDESIASHVTPPSTTVPPSVDGQVGSVAALYAALACTAL